MTNAQLIAIIDDYLAQHVLALSDLHANPVWGQVAITIQGQVTIIRRRQTARLIRSLVILEYVGTGLSNGILVPKRGLMYYYIGQLGPEAKSSFPREFKRTVNSLGLPTNLLCSTEPKTLCCGDLHIKNMETGDEFDLLKHCQLDMSIVKGGRYEIVRRGPIERILVIEKASIWRLMVQTDFHKKMNALVITGKGFPSTQCRAWLYNFRIMLSISEENCIGIGDYGPYRYALLHSYSYVKDPIKVENVFQTRVRIIITPAFMSNFPEVMTSMNMKFSDADFNIFKFLLNEENEFFKENGELRMDQLKKMWKRKYKCDIDLLCTKKLLAALKMAIESGDKAI